MKTFKYLVALLPLAGIATLASCDSDDPKINWEESNHNAAAVVSASVEEGAQIGYETESILLKYDTEVVINANVKPTINGVSVLSCDYPILEDGDKDYTTVEIGVALEPGTQYVLEVPERAIVGINSDVWAKAFTLNFSTPVKERPTSTLDPLHNKNATAEAKALYTYLCDNYGKTMLSGAMGGVAWEHTYADMIASENGGKQPAVVGFDYIHLASSPANWIDYGDITPIKRTHDEGGVVAMSWHWNVPETAPDAPETNVKAVVWEGEKAMPADWSGYIIIESSKFADTAVGDVIKVYTQKVAAGAQGSFKNGATWGEIGPGTEWFDITGDFTLSVTADILASLNSSGLIVSGHDYTATKVAVLGSSAKAPSRASLSTHTGEFMPSNVMIEGTWENQVAEADVAKLAGYLQLLQDANIPVLWRPLHEAAGDYTWGAWFWWGQEGVEVTKQLWVWLHDKLTYEYGLNNLIWVWTMCTSSAGNMADIALISQAYPGDEYVDIVGVDLYPSETLTDQSSQFNIVNDVVAGKKIVALTECGNLIDPESAYKKGALWSWFMQWYDMDNGGFGHTNYEGSQWSTVLSSPYVVNRGIKY